MDNFPYLFAAYTIIFVILLVYVFSLQQRLGRLRQEMDNLKASLKDKGGRS
ncbi:MAG: CcmD family protein [Chloroflexi bacterium]|nr:CcmD family protein [Chloroflexota bacterium]